MVEFDVYERINKFIKKQSTNRLYRFDEQSP